ncbi:hypothetical protein COJ46_09730 [Bacillus sp. AFS077874]|nr:hypothetical protein CON00_15870 [Bacillus sp. AFS096315]PFM81189.1 hypothetical protein COJ46_09730 [Bacillus sp. AFS077874]
MKKLIILIDTVLTMLIFTACEKMEALESKSATTEQTSPTMAPVLPGLGFLSSITFYVKELM